MNVLIKRLAICGVLYAVAETSFMMGKGYILGLLKGYGASASYATELLNGDDANWKCRGCAENCGDIKSGGRRE